MEKVRDFLAAVAELQEEYGMYIVTEMEEPILLSLETNANNHNIICYTNRTYIDELSSEAVFDPINIGAFEDAE